MIRAPQIRLVGEKGEQLGLMPPVQALDLARKQGLDLVEVAPTANPPVCRILDFGKFKYEQEKKEQEAKRHQRKTSALREIRLRPKIGEHDFDAKSRSVRKLLGEGAKVKVTVMFRGREITHPDLGWKLLQRVVDSLKDVSQIDRQAAIDGKRMDVMLAPLPQGKTRPKEEPRVKEEVKVKEEVRS